MRSPSRRVIGVGWGTTVSSPSAESGTAGGSSPPSDGTAMGRSAMAARSERQGSPRRTRTEISSVPSTSVPPVAPSSAACIWRDTSRSVRPSRRTRASSSATRTCGAPRSMEARTAVTVGTSRITAPASPPSRRRTRRSGPAMRSSTGAETAGPCTKPRGITRASGKRRGSSSWSRGSSASVARADRVVTRSCPKAGAARWLVSML